jgi:hypothetical protein
MRRWYSWEYRRDVDEDELGTPLFERGKNRLTPEKIIHVYVDDESGYNLLKVKEYMPEITFFLDAGIIKDDPRQIFLISK